MALATGVRSSTNLGGLPNYLQPSQGKGLYSGNYLNFLDSDHEQWAQQFLPDVYDKEIEIYGNRTISGFLKMVSAEMPSSSDQIIWLEQGRLHTRYSGITFTTTAAAATQAQSISNASGFVGLGAAAKTIPAGAAWHGSFGTQATPFGSQTSTDTDINGDQGECNFRVGQTVMAQVSTEGVTVKGVVTAVAATSFIFVSYESVSIAAAHTTATGTALVYGSEFAKGTGNFTDKLDPSYSTYSNSPIIMKEHYAINGSDTGQIGWVEVTSENGASGYLWYVKAEHENRLRWEDYLEMSMVEGVTNDVAAGSRINSLRNYKEDFGGALATSATNGAGARGTEGFFQALEKRGNLYQDLTSDLRLGRTTPAFATAGGQTGITSNANGGLNAFDSILKQMDKQGAIEENMIYVNRDLSLAFTDMLAAINSTGNALGTSYGVFNNSEDMALKLHFNGFRRGSYDFYQTDWKYLNDFSTRGAFDDIEGVLIPAGTSTVYDQNLGSNIKRPFLHVRYRASETDNRKMKSWITGSVGGAYTTDVDEMRMHYLTERCLITQGANNFFLFQS